jgi:hypothetical protein
MDAGGGDASEGGAADGGGDGGSDGGSEAGAADAGDGGTTSQALFRVGALMRFPAPVDFCWQQGGASWNGPVMLGWGVPARLAYGQVTDYVSVPVAATTVRIVNGSATDCNTAVVQVAFTPAAANDAFFVAELDQGNVAPQAKSFLDERTTTAPTNTKLRAIHVAITGLTSGGPVGQSVDFYVGGGATTSLFDDVAFGATAAAGNGVDSNGYLSHDTFDNADMRVRLHTGLVDLLDAPAFGTTAGHVYSLFTIGVHSPSPQNTTPMRLLVCDDSAAPVGHLGVCNAVGTQL